MREFKLTWNLQQDYGDKEGLIIIPAPDLLKYEIDSLLYYHRSNGIIEENFLNVFLRNRINEIAFRTCLLYISKKTIQKRLSRWNLNFLSTF